MTVLELATNYLLPIAGPLLLAAGLLSWQRSDRFWSGRSLAPKGWQTAAIVTGAAMLAGYVGFVLPASSPALRVVTVLIIVQPAVVAGLAWLIGRTASHRSPSSRPSA